MTLWSSYHSSCSYEHIRLVSFQLLLYDYWSYISLFTQVILLASDRYSRPHDFTDLVLSQVFI